jgi:hypothetical protein
MIEVIVPWVDSEGVEPGDASRPDAQRPDAQRADAGRPDRPDPRTSRPSKHELSEFPEYFLG